jgi:hypothetical protein
MAMRNLVHTAAASLLAVLPLLQVACGGSPSTDGTDNGTTPAASDPNAPTDSNAPPSKNLTGATVGDPHAAIQGAASEVGSDKDDSSPSSGSSGGTKPPVKPPVTPPDPNAGAGPKPTATCSVTKDSAGFFTRGSGASSYVAYVPATYSGTKPVQLIVGVHGCGDSAYNFATWGVNPYETRTTQTHIGISIGGEDGNCWSAADDPKVLAAIADISSCFWVHQKKVSLAGYSSGGELSYRVGLANAGRFAGILIEDSGLYEAGVNETTALANASWKLHIAHLTHTSDPVYPLASVQADWSKETAAGFPLVTDQTAGDHNGTSTDWATWLIPHSAAWTAP